MRRTALLALIPALTLAACGNDQQSGSDASAAATSVASTSDNAGLQVLLVGADQAPEGMTYEDFYATVGGTGMTDNDVIEPAQCGILAFDSASLLAWGELPKDETAVAMYTRGEDMALVRLDATPSGLNPDDCNVITRASTSALGTTVTTYSTFPHPVNVAGATNVQYIKQFVEGQTLDDAPTDTGKVGTSVKIVIGEAGGKQFTLVGTGDVSPAELAGLAEEQVKKLS